MPLNDYIPTLIHTVVMIYILMRLYLLATEAKRSISLVFFTFATVAYLLTDFYWIVFDLLHPMTRMPFAANEVAELAIFISLASSVAAVTGEFFAPAKSETAGALAFLTANVALWIVWSGEWVQDIITGIVMGYFFTRLIRHMKQTGTLPAPAWRLLGTICAVVIAANVATLYVQDRFKSMTDLAAYLLMLAVDLYFAYRTLRSLASGNNPGLSISLSFAVSGWNILFLYMSAGLFYNIANLFSAFSWLLMFAALRKEVMQNIPSGEVLK